MPATSQQQQKLFGLALAFKRGEVSSSEVSDEIKGIANRMSEKDIEDFAATKHNELPKMKEQLRKVVKEIMKENVISQLIENDPCWKDYEMVGMKMKDGKEVPNCVPKNESSINEIEYKNAVEKFNADLMKNSQVERIAKFHKKSIKDVVKALQPYIKVLRYNDKSVKVISIDFRDTNSEVKVHVSQTYNQNESVNEGRYDADLDKIEAAVMHSSSFMNVGSELKKMGIKYDFSTSMIPMYRIKVSGNTIAIVNKKYASDAERTVKDIAIGLMENVIKESLSPEVAKHMGSIHKGFKMVENDGVMVYDSPNNAKKAADFLNSKKIAASFDGKYVYLESVNEAFKHIIHVDTPTQVVSKPVAAQIMALAKKGVRSKEIGLEMGFTGNAKLAADAFQKVKNRIYFELDKRESTINEEVSKEAMGIAGFTGTRGIAVQQFIDKHNLDAAKLFKSIKMANLQGRLNFVTALVGKDGNPNQKLTIKLHQKK